MFDTQEVLASGLSAARLRINVLASNIANAETTRTETGGPYKRRDVVQIAAPLRSAYSSSMDDRTLARPSIVAVVEDQSAPRMVYRPGHPDANEDGLVAYPNINVVSTLTDLMTASRMYQAVVTAIETARTLSSDSLRISVRG